MYEKLSKLQLEGGRKDMKRIYRWKITLAIKKIQIKTTVKCYYITITKVRKKIIVPSSDENVEKLYH